MKKISSLKKKLAAFGLAICTFVTSTGVNMCEAAENKVEKSESNWITNAKHYTEEAVKLSAYAVLLGFATYGCIKTTFVRTLFIDASTLVRVISGLGVAALAALASAAVKDVATLAGLAMETVGKTINLILNSKVINSLLYVFDIPISLVKAVYYIVEKAKKTS